MGCRLKSGQIDCMISIKWSLRSVLAPNLESPAETRGIVAQS